MLAATLEGWRLSSFQGKNRCPPECELQCSYEMFSLQVMRATSNSRHTISSRVIFVVHCVRVTSSVGKELPERMPRVVTGDLKTPEYPC